MDSKFSQVPNAVLISEIAERQEELAFRTGVATRLRAGVAQSYGISCVVWKWPYVLQFILVLIGGSCAALDLIFPPVGEMVGLSLFWATLILIVGLLMLRALRKQYDFVMDEFARQYPFYAELLDRKE